MKRLARSLTARWAAAAIGLALLGVASAACPGSEMPGSCADPDFCPPNEVCALGDGNTPVCVPEDNLLGPRACDDDDDCNPDERCLSGDDGGLLCIYAPGDGGS